MFWMVLFIVPWGTHLRVHYKLFGILAYLSVNLIDETFLVLVLKFQQLLDHGYPP